MKKVRANMDKMRVVKGPVLVDGRIIARVVGDYDEDVTGSGIWVEGWTGSEWTSNAEGIPSMNEVLKSPSASTEILKEAGVPEDPWPDGYELNEIELPLSWLEEQDSQRD